MAANLCEPCGSINFEALRPPLESDLPALCTNQGQVNSSRYPFKNNPQDADKNVRLGTFGEITERAKACRLCKLIVDMVTQHLDGVQQDDVCHAGTSPFSKFTGLRSSHGLCRLDLTVESKPEEAGSTEATKRTLYNAFQPCDIGISEPLVGSRDMDRMIFGGRPRPPKIDLGRLRQWIGFCDNYHGKTCGATIISMRDRPNYLRFIDVKERCIVTFAGVQPTSHKYLALSYVRGGELEFTLKKSNEMHMRWRNSLPENLPRTVEDAMALTEAMGLSYLWVDFLCIIQDDKDDWANSTETMNLIYGSSYFTIVAASGSDVHAGLAGLREARSVEQQEVVVLPARGMDGDGDGDGDKAKSLPGLSLMTSLDPLHHPKAHFLDGTVWNTRGWTLQENLLSRRMLIFTDQQAYWFCREKVFCEESHLESDGLHFHGTRAMQGEHALVRTFGVNARYDMPQTKTIRGTFWRVYHAIVSKYSKREFTNQGDVFSAFVGISEALLGLSGVDFTWGHPNLYFEKSLLWKSFDPLRRRKALSTMPMPKWHSYVPYPSWSWMGWVGEAHVVVGDPRQHAVVETPEILCYYNIRSPRDVALCRLQTQEPSAAPRLPAWKRHHDQPVDISDVAAQHQHLFYAELGKIPDRNVIFFWTSSAKFGVGPPPFPGSRVSIIDAEGHTVGAAGFIHPDRKHYSEGTYEFIVMGSRQGQSNEKILIVFQIEWREHLAYRVNSGEILEKAWLAADHEWKLIAMR